MTNTSELRTWAIAGLEMGSRPAGDVRGDKFLGTVLLMTDDAEVALSLSGFFASIGYEVELAETSDDAHASLVKSQVDFAIIDLEYEGAAELVRIAQTLQKVSPVRVALLVGQDCIDSLPNVSPSDVALVRKPIRPGDLLDVVNDE